MGEERLFKSRVLLKITEFEKVGEENNQTSLKITNEIYDKVKGKDLVSSLYGTERKVQVVNSAPKNFQFGVLYVLQTGDRAWIFKQKED